MSRIPVEDGSKFKKILLRDTSFLSFLLLVSKSVGLILVPLLAKYLSVTDFGVLAMMNLLIIVGELLTRWGMTNGLYKFYQPQIDGAVAKQVVWNSLIITLLLSSLVVSGMAFFADGLSYLLTGDSAYSELVYWTLLTVWVHALNEIPRSILRADRKMKDFSMLSMSHAMILLISTLVLLRLDSNGLRAFIIAIFVTEMMSTGFGFFLIRNSIGGSVDWHLMKKLGCYSAPFVFQQMEGAGIVPLSQYLIRFFFGLEAAGLVNMARRFSLPMIVLCKSLQDTWAPLKFSMHRDVDSPVHYFGRLSSQVLIMLFAAWTLNFLWGAEGVRLLTPSTFHSAEQYLPLFTLIPVVHTIYLLASTGLELGQKTMIVSFIHVLGLGLVFLIVWIASQKEDLTLACMAPALAWAFMALAILRWSQRSFRIVFEWKTVATIFGVAITQWVVWDLYLEATGSLQSMIRTLGLSLCSLGSYGLVWRLLLRTPLNSSKKSETVDSQGIEK